MKVLVKMRSMSTSQGMARNGDIVELPKAEVDKILAARPHTIEVLAEEAPKKAPKKTAAKKKRARNADGTLKADDPSTPDVNEAWEDG
jgi:hypothetical protein